MTSGTILKDLIQVALTGYGGWPLPLLFIETLTVLLCDKNYCDTFITMSYLTAKIRNVSEISTYFVGILRLLRYFCFDG